LQNILPKTKMKEKEMKVIKEGGHRLFEEDQETTRYVREMLDDLRKNGMDAARKYSQKFDDWNPTRFELSEQQINEAIAKCDEQLVQDTEFCQNNVRAFAEAQLATMQPLEVEVSPGVIFPGPGCWQGDDRPGSQRTDH
jgi:sulfopropanediol 3-dehydrogenase